MSRFRARDGVVVTGEGTARFLVSMETGDLFEVNEPALLVFEATRGGITAIEAADVLCATYPDVPRAEIEVDAREILAAMARHGLVEAIDG